MVSDKPHNDALAEDGDERSNSRRANPIDKHVGERVRMRRMLLGMSQERLGEQLGLTFQQVQKYEKGVNRIGAGRLFDLSHVLGVPIQFFYEDAPTYQIEGASHGGFAEKSPGETELVDFMATREGLELNKAFVRVTDARVRRSLIELIRSLADAP
mgnify:CR=1 FL=1